MTSRLHVRGGVATITFAGELDMSTLPLARRAVAEAEAAGARGLVLDLRAVGFFDLSGLRLLFEAHEHWGSRLRVVNGPDHVDDLVEFSGLEHLLSHRGATGASRSSVRKRFRRE